jgi:hypothetical protein
MTNINSKISQSFSLKPNIEKVMVDFYKNISRKIIAR